MSEWFLILTFILVALVLTFLLAEWLSHRYSLALRDRISSLAEGEPNEGNDPFDPDEPTAS